MLKRHQVFASNKTFLTEYCIVTESSMPLTDYDPISILKVVYFVWYITIIKYREDFCHRKASSKMATFLTSSITCFYDVYSYIMSQCLKFFFSFLIHRVITFF